MFNLKSFIVTNIVDGVKNGTFTKEYANIMAVNYMLKGAIGEEEVVSVSSQIEAWEEEMEAQKEVVEIDYELPEGELENDYSLDSDSEGEPLA